MAVIVSDYRAGDHMSARFVTMMPLAAFVTVLLFLLMHGMISVQFTSTNAVKNVLLNIKPIIEELKVRQPLDLPQRVDDITPPPPPPRILNQSAEQPNEAISAIAGSIPELQAALVDSKSINFRIADSGVLPIVRIAPLYPNLALRRGQEGDCTAVFDVNSIGEPYNVVATCSSSVFVRPVQHVILNWKYKPKVIDGVAVIREGVRALLCIFDWMMNKCFVVSSDSAKVVKRAVKSPYC